MRRKGLDRSSAPMKAGGFKSAAFNRSAAKEAGAVVKVKRAMKSSQRAVSADEKLLWDRLAARGCVACLKDGRFNPHVSIHHCDGRTKPDCHKRVLALCGSHHQDDGSGAIAIHPWKAQFEAKYGTQAELMAEWAEALAGQQAGATAADPDQSKT